MAASTWDEAATRPHAYRNPRFPAHFTRTRCVFADGQFCLKLEKFARSRAQHPWTFKPSVCWLFPMQESAGKPVAPVADQREDPFQLADYPGYETIVNCGRHDAAGRLDRSAGGRAGLVGASEVAADPRIPGPHRR